MFLKNLVMKSNYKKLGEYIELVNVINSDLYYGEVDVIGVSNNKEIIQTRANNEGREFNNFYVVAPNAFIYNSRTSRMGDKVGLGYNDSETNFITSFNNTVFRVKNEALIPMFLFMWFKRPEFDRYVRFHSWGSSTEIFSWEEMCKTLLPIPHPDKQREIVKEYITIQNRINLNKKLLQKLEETTQAIYKQWFVDFEFPDENGNPYKSNGGEMEFNEELEKDIPKGWEVKKLNSVFNFNQGSEPGSSSYCSQKISNEYVNFYRVQDIFKYNYFPELFVNKNLLKGRLFNSEDILVSLDGTIGRVFMGGEGGYSSGIRKVSSDKEYVSNPLIFCFLKSNYFKESLNLLSGSETTIKHAGKAIKDMYFVFDKNICIKFSKVVEPIYRQILLKGRQDNLLEKSRELLLSKLATINN